MAGALTRLASGVGAGGTAVALSLQPALLVPVLVAVAALGGLPVLLITTLALVAVYSRRPDRRAAAEKILDRLLTALRPPQFSKVSGSKGRKATE
jgi:nitrate/nitrite transporter NarK